MGWLKGRLLAQYRLAAQLKHLALPGRRAACREAANDREGNAAPSTQERV
jgi:hypothetical protein